MGARECRRQPLGQLPGPHRDREQHRRGRRPLEQSAEQLDRGRVGPVDVVEDEHERPRRCEELQQLADCAVAAVALVLGGGRAARVEAGERGEDGRKLRPDLWLELVEAPRLDAADVLVEGVDEDPERQLLLELRRRARQHEVIAFVRASRKLREEPRLADPRLADELDHGRRPLVELRQGAVERFELRSAPHELLGHLGHRRLLAPDDTSGQAAREIRVRNQGGAPMPGRRASGRLDPCSVPAPPSRTPPHDIKEKPA